ncbi:MAG TPA: adenine phosphoribosyltransferase [bacterium]|nr:adenine phosphoribosyltransferase [bacterium]HOL47973.1 adenine phosphoribosyltransferase [bacterium]HPQ18039.1 adenine phosphoribosyltransferase [bacterium]
MSIKNLENFIRDVPNFPKEGIIFKDITPLLQNQEAFRKAIKTISNLYKDKNIDIVVGAEARGFIFAAPVAFRLEAGFVPVRKPGKLPYQTIKEEFQLEYGVDAFEIHTDAIKENQNVLIVDDVLATGGTAQAIAKLVEKLKGNVVGICFLIELTFLNGRDKLKNYNVESLIKF